MLHLLSLVPVVGSCFESSTSGKWYKCLITLLSPLNTSQMLHLSLPGSCCRSLLWILNLENEAECLTTVLPPLYLKSNVTLTLPGSNGSGLTWTLSIRKMKQVFDYCAIAALFDTKCYTLLSPVVNSNGWLEPSTSGKWFKCLTTVLPPLYFMPYVTPFPP